MSLSYRVDQMLILEAGLMSDGADVHELTNLLAGYEGAAHLGEHELAAQAEVNLRRWVIARRLQKTQALQEKFERDNS